MPRETNGDPLGPVHLPARGRGDPPVGRLLPGVRTRWESQA